MSEAKERLKWLLSSDLSFANYGRSLGIHSLHAYAARFPSPLPRHFIEGLSRPGAVVLDPMAGSGATSVEAWLLSRTALSIDFDPLSARLCKAKTTWIEPELIRASAERILSQALLHLRMADPLSEFRNRTDSTSIDFINYWFTEEVQRELASIVLAIGGEQDSQVRTFLEVVFSSIIVTKSGGVSLARDLAHSRPHKVSDKKPSSPLRKFELSVQKAAQALEELRYVPVGASCTVRGDVRHLGIPDESIDLIVTSPPYANALDYMRAHKFSLVWLQMDIPELSRLRSEYIGSERQSKNAVAKFPEVVQAIISSLESIDRQKSLVLQKYFGDMHRAIGEMYRVLRHGAATILVVGTSTMHGLPVETHTCLAHIAAQIGFDVVDVVGRPLDRNKRMMPMRRQNQGFSIIEQRMTEEFVIGLVKT